MLGLYKYVSDFSEVALSGGENYWNQKYYNTFVVDEVCYFVVTLDCSDIYRTDEDGTEYYKQTFYMNGTKLYEGGYNCEQWEEFKTNYIANISYFGVGCCFMTEMGYWHFSQMNAYSLRLYARGLTEEEVLENYNTSVAYHTLLENMN